MKLEVTKKTKGDNENIYLQPPHRERPDARASSGRRRATPLSRSSRAPVTVIVDTREQEPYSFDPRLVTPVRRALPAGDYSVAGPGETVAVERKTLDDFVSTVIHSRARFRRELRKLGRLPGGVRRGRGGPLGCAAEAATGATRIRTRCSAARSSIILDYRRPGLLLLQPSGRLPVRAGLFARRAREVESSWQKPA